MQSLRIAIEPARSAELHDRWDELTASAWRQHVTVHHLQGVAQKFANDAQVANLAIDPNALVLAASHVTTKHAVGDRINVRRLPARRLETEVERWLQSQNLVWRARAKTECEKTGFSYVSADDWVEQFRKIDPNCGHRAGAAILAQFKIIGEQEMGGLFRGLSPVDTHIWFAGADDQSGDFALVSLLAGGVTNHDIYEAAELEKQKNGTRARLYCDGSWSGGETLRRVRCLFTDCENKKTALNSTQILYVHVGYLTDKAHQAIQAELSELAAESLTQKGHVKVTAANLLPVESAQTGQRGLAFHNFGLLAYVDSKNPKTLKNLCTSIGKQLLPDHPLGTSDIASCIGFKHSLPSAMLPVFTMGGQRVKAADGTDFVWKALLRSEHFIAGKPDNAQYHCDACPLGDRSRVAAVALQQSAASTKASPSASAGSLGTADAKLNHGLKKFWSWLAKWL